jgi:sterol desaturase/sphingolipid hydroxylase (fatty acid hydroxylase superfamily)
MPEIKPEYVASAIIAFAALSAMVFERIFPYTPGQRLFRKHFLTDWLYYSIVFGLAMDWLCRNLLFPGVDWMLGNLSRQGLMSAWPVWAGVTFSLFTHDLFIYLFHRWMHANKYLWRIHEAHHSPREVDWAAGSRAHVFEAIITITAEFGPLVFLAAKPAVTLYKGAIDAVWGMFIHSNLDVKLGWLQKIINGPQMHRWHHSRDVHNINFATKFAFWDWMFGTAYLPEDRKPGRYGIELEWSRNIFTHQLVAFRPYEKPDAGAAEAAAEGVRVEDAGQAEEQTAS